VSVFFLYAAMTPKSSFDSAMRALLADVARPTNTKLQRIKPGDNSELSRVVSGANVPFSVEIEGTRPSRITLHYSVDGGKAFSLLSPEEMLNRAPAVDHEGFADQVVTYVPKYDLFVWVIQSGVSKTTGSNVYRIAVATPAQIVAGKGKTWTFWDLSSKALSGAGKWYDYEEVSVGDNYLYLSFNVVGGDAMEMVRLSLADLAAPRSVAGRFFTTKGWWIRSVQNVGPRALFATHASDGVLRIFSWDESALNPVASDVGIPTIANDNWVTKLPDGSEWLPGLTKIGSNVQGATKAGDELWFAWSAAREVRVKGALVRSWPQPRVEIAVVNATTLKLVRMRVPVESHHGLRLACAGDERGRRGRHLVRFRRRRSAVRVPRRRHPDRNAEPRRDDVREGRQGLGRAHTSGSGRTTRTTSAFRQPASTSSRSACTTARTTSCSGARARLATRRRRRRPSSPPARRAASAPTRRPSRAPWTRRLGHQLVLRVGHEHRLRQQDASAGGGLGHVGRGGLRAPHRAHSGDDVPLPARRRQRRGDGVRRRPGVHHEHRDAAAAGEAARSRDQRADQGLIHRHEPRRGGPPARSSSA